LLEDAEEMGLDIECYMTKAKTLSGRAYRWADLLEDMELSDKDKQSGDEVAKDLDALLAGLMSEDDFSVK